MRFYILRHGEAEAGHPDAERQLTVEGRREIEWLAEKLEIQEKHRPNCLWVSPLIRARETAELFCRCLGWSLVPTITEDLIPSGNPARVARNLIEGEQSALVVGHNPHLEMLVSYFLSGHSDGVLAVMNTGSLACLEYSQLGGNRGSSFLRYLISPNTLSS